MKFLLPLLLCLSLAACKFVVPDGQEQEELVRRGAFPNGVPAWYSPNKRIDNKPVIHKDSGIAAERYFVPQAARQAHSNLDYVSNNIRQFEGSAEVEEQREEVDELDSLSPLERIEQICPGVEGEVRKALLTEQRGVRVLKYESLSKRCQESTDIWLWMAKDYRAMGDYSRAEGALNRVLELKPENSEAKALLREVRDAAIKGGI